jgi:hypothetical protein
MSELDRVRARYQHWRGKRDAVSSIIDEAYEYSIPLRERVYPSGSVRADDRLFDTTACDAVDDLASSVVGDLWPTDSRPFDLQPGRSVPPDQRKALAQSLQDVADAIIDAVNQDESMFAASIGESMKDWTICDGVMLMEMGDLQCPFRFVSLPPAQCTLGVGPWGQYDQLYRERTVKASHIEVLWPNGEMSPALREKAQNTPDADVKMLEASWRDYTRKGETWVFMVAAEGEDKPLVRIEDEGEGACPFLAWSFSRRANENVGRGIVQLCLASIRTLNLAVEMTLDHGELALAGVWQMDDDGVVNVDNITLQPGTIIPKAPGTDGLKNLAPTGDFSFAEFIIERETQRVRQALLKPELGDPTKTPRSATEVLERATARAKRLSGPAKRLLAELMVPMVKRAMWIMSRLGGVEVPKLDGKAVVLRPLGPITKAQAKQDILDFTQFMQVGNSTLGPQAMATVVNQEEAVPWLAEAFGVRPKLIRDEAQKKQLAEAIAGLAQTAADAGMIPGVQAGGPTS